MFLKYLVYPVLVMLLSALPVSSNAANEDIYFSLLKAENSVVGCADDESLDRLLQGEAELLGGLCDTYAVSDEIIGKWVFLDPPVWADGTEEFIVARKYVMETEKGQVRFIWPDPLDVASVSLAPSEEELFHEDELMMDYYDQPPVLDLSPALRDNTEMVFVRY